MYTKCGTIFEKYSQLFEENFNYEDDLTMEVVLSDVLPMKDQTCEKKFLDDFINAEDKTEGGSVARFILGYIQYIYFYLFKH